VQRDILGSCESPRCVAIQSAGTDVFRGAAADKCGSLVMRNQLQDAYKGGLSDG